MADVAPARPDLTGSGTPEAEWTPWLDVEPLPAADWGSPRRLVVVAPHPDDEVLALGGSVAMLRRDGWDVGVVAVTDGEASHPGSTRVDRASLAATRREESIAALAEIGVPATAIDRLGLPDGGVADHEHALADALVERLGPDDLVAVPHRRDGHPDHEAAARAGLRAVEAVGADVVEYPVWLWHWTAPGSPLWTSARLHRLDPAAQLAKARAISAFASQIHPHGPDPADQPILPAAILARFQRTVEVVL
ncbi:PIG-L deacetylase family protein [Euzebya sp.]|uniref:PIG-L deacetylase family protein n=1 Tax=Euzebya sp. TaxID=1971409 RepID=UPI0035195B00